MTNTGISEEVALYKMIMLPNENDFEDTLIHEFGWVKDEFCVWIRHYILATNSYKKDHLYAIRIPGGTVGDIETDNNDIILNLTIDVNYVVRTYPKNINEIIQKYIGEKIEFEDEENEEIDT